jgi:2-dehydro-3-deoxyphosphogluconate aldolase/(4S)-4-hydroxy-2-oxoglutarate aldolase
MTPEQFVEHVRVHRATAILRTDDEGRARKAMEAAVRGGFRTVEFTLTVPNAMGLIREFSEKKDLVVGAGTVLTVGQAEEAVAAGAKFLVSPVVDEAVIRKAAELGVAVIPGAFTPTEMKRAHDAGAPLVKLFPAPGTGATYVRQIVGPMPFLKIIPTAGVDASNAKAFLDAGAWGVGFVSSLFKAEDIAAENYDAIEARAKEQVCSTGAPV